MTTRNLLVIAYIFPPLAGAGVYRTLKFVKYLPEHGIIPVVVCAEDPDWYLLDETGELSADISVSIRVERVSPGSSLKAAKATVRYLRSLTGSSKSSSDSGVVSAPAAPASPGLKRRILDRLMVPDEQRSWIKPASRRATSLARTLTGTTCLYSSGPPFSAHLAALQVKRRTGLPWIADFRDAWSGNPVLNKTLSPTVLAKHAALEAQVINEADVILAVAPGVVDVLCRTYPSAARKIELLTNGFDPDDFADIETVPSADRFTISHVGELSHTRIPSAFLEALSEVRKAMPETPLEARFVGYRDPLVVAVMDNLVSSLGLGDVVTTAGPASHAEALRLMAGSHVLLMQSAFTSADAAAGQTYPGKLFEYMASRRPVLAIVPEGATSALIQETGCGVSRDPGDVEGITSVLRAWVTRWEAGEQLLDAEPCITGFERRELSGRLAEIVDRLLGDTTQTAD